ncbi:hypothetical protein B0H13DRAFT_2300808 [Mycena leptocephala]|nr:hypothetical protein B0H13DRAFT_2300808 [Mycena leptocephala]
MSSYIPSDSTSATPGLSAAAPFADVLRTRSEDAPLPHSTKALEAAGPSVAPPAYTQKGLGKTHAAGLRNAQDSLAANSGSIPSSSRLLPLPPSRPGVDDGEPLNGPPLGPPSTKRGVTRSATLPEGALGATAPAAGAPVIASHSPATDSLALDRSPTPPVSAPCISTVAHFGMTEYTDPKAETALHMAKRTNKDLHVLADALHVNETRVQRLEVDVNKVIIEHRLSNLFPSDDLRFTRPRSPSVTQNRSRSPTRGRSRSTTPRCSHSPQPDNQSRSPAHSFHDPIDELYGRVEELEDVGRASREDLTARIAALEEDNSEGSSAISVKELSVAAARRFTEITSDRNILDSAIKLQAGRGQTINRELRNFTALQAQLTRLEINTPAPLRSSSHSSHSKAPDLPSVHTRHSLPVLRSRSPTLDPPSKRRKFHEGGGFLTVGPFPASQLSPTDLFVSLVDGALPTFRFTDLYSVTLDPVFPYHLRVTLKSAVDVQSLLKAWGTGARTVGMEEMNSNGSNEPKPLTKRDSQPSASYRGSKSHRGHNSVHGRS